jgi:general secretion pathway protein B
MSYILDALKKIEQKRAQEESLKPISFYDATGEAPRKRPVWPFLVVAALVLNAGLLVWWIGIKGLEKNSIPTSPPSKTPPAPVAALKGSGEQLKAIKKEMPVLRKPQPPEPPAPTKEASPSKPPLEKTSTPKPAKMEPVPPVAKENALPEKTTPVKRSNKVVALEDLPESVKKGLPGFKVSTHVYGSDSDSRLIRINDKTLQEGQEVAPGIKLEEIIQSGAILNYQGYRFRIGLKD